MALVFIGTGTKLTSDRLLSTLIASSLLGVGSGITDADAAEVQEKIRPGHGRWQPNFAHGSRKKAP